MNGQINQLVKSLLQKESLEQCSVQELQQFADRHPYFGAAQLLLTKKLQTENSEKYNEQLQKTFLFFHNPLWVEQLLNDTGNGTMIAHEPEGIARDIREKKEAVIAAETPGDSVETKETPRDTPQPVLSVELPVEGKEHEPVTIAADPVEILTPEPVKE